MGLLTKKDVIRNMAGLVGGGSEDEEGEGWGYMASEEGLLDAEHRGSEESI
jgi:hypothetical protein